MIANGRRVRVAISLPVLLAVVISGLWTAAATGSNNIAPRSRALPPTHSRFTCSGAPSNEHFARPRRGDNGFKVRIEGDPESYEPGREYVVSLQSTLPSYFRGFTVRATGASDSSAVAGQFSPVNSYTSWSMPSCRNVITHVNPGKKTRILTRWVAPSSGFGCVNISASVVQKGSIWFKDSGRLTLTLCERSAAPPADETSGCCACGRATYRMTFYGLWSPQTHPKDYPPYSTHWSNVVGASHTPDYVIWEYGDYASDGVQKVAEWGWPNNVETEIRAQGDDVMSVIKTKAQWPAYEPRNLRSPPSDTFQVDADRYLVSMLTMLGPSPDWNVGITKESLCTEECGWAGVRTYNLTPWDAGTDGGVSYMSPNSPTVPHEKIRPLTTSDHPQSPFYNPNGGPIPPVARVVVRRLSVTGEQCGDNEAIPEIDDFDVDAASRSDSDVTSCMYGEWSDWSACGVTCGWGIKTRNRMVKYSGGDETACEATMEKEICKGTGACERNTDVTACMYSDWTSWSLCGASCGQATRFRSRVLKWPSEERYCHEPLKEMSSCNLPSCDANITCTYSPWSRWMPCSVTCGFGTTLRKRFVTYTPPQGTCSGPLMQNSQCMTSMSCIADPGFDTADCTYSPWSEWSACPVTCGVGQAFRKRLLESSSAGATCSDFQMENTKCMTSASCVDENAQPSGAECTYGDWTDWMPCSVSCGIGNTLRKKFLRGSDAVGICEGFIMENAECHNRPCEAVRPSDNCIYLPWSRWMPCSTTCGVGETLRKRFLNDTASDDDCQSFEMETNKCMVSCDVTNSMQCMYSDWSQWMPCSASCGRTGTTFRKRGLKFAPAHVTCEEVLVETKSCSGSPCSNAQSLRDSAEACVTSSWQTWSGCSNTCGKRGIIVRQRVEVNTTSSSACPASSLMQRRRCRTENRCRRTNAPTGRDCKMTEWGQWLSCGTECRVKFQIRRRRVLVLPKGRGQRCGRNKEKKPCRCNQSR